MRVGIIFALLIFGLYCQERTVKTTVEKSESLITPSIESFFEFWNIRLNEDFKRAVKTHIEEARFIKLNDFLSMRITKSIYKSEPFDKTRFSIILDYPETKLRPRNDKIFNFRDKKIAEIYRYLTYDKVEAIGNTKIGLAFTYSEGQLEEISCHHLAGENGAQCEESILLNADGSIREVKDFKRKCNQGCGQFQPLRQPGKYFISTNQVRVREKPETKSKIIIELSKDTPIEVISDAEIYEEIGPHYGTWGKVKLDDGKEGYVYGAFLRAPGEPDVVAIKEKAEEWKKENGVKGK